MKITNLNQYVFFRLCLILAVLFGFLPISVSVAQRYEYDSIQMGVPVKIILYAESKELADMAAKEAFAEFQRLNSIMSDYDSDSELMRMCRHFAETEPKQSEKADFLPISDDLFAVLVMAKKFSSMTDGAFDVTVGPCVRLWRRARRQNELPKEKLLTEAKSLVGNYLWELDEDSKAVKLKKPGMKFDLGGIAKGYAIDKAFDTIQARGISSVLVDAGGDFRLGDSPPESGDLNGAGWKIEFQDGKVELLSNIAMATSGDTFQFVEIDGVRYAHIIDPKTGLGLTSVKTVTISAATATEADAMASAAVVIAARNGELQPLNEK